MTVLLSVIAVLLLILLLPVSLCIGYDGQVDTYVKLLFFKIRFKNRKKKKKKHPDEKPAAPKKQSGHKKLIDDINKFAKIIPKLFGHALRSLTLDTLYADITVATGDPCTTALAYGAVNTALYPAVSLIGKYVKIKDKQIKVTADYDADKTTANASLKVSTCLLRLLICLVRMISDGLTDLL